VKKNPFMQNTNRLMEAFIFTAAFDRLAAFSLP
jgi:hypothetical protein